MKRIITVILVFMVIISCSSSNVYMRDTPIFPNSKEDKGIVYFYRPSKFKLAAVGYKIYQDDTIIARSINGKYFFTILYPGEYCFSLTDPNNRGEKNELKLTIEAGKIYYIKIEASLNMLTSVSEVLLKEVSELIGSEEIKSCSYATSW